MFPGSLTETPTTGHFFFLRSVCSALPGWTECPFGCWLDLVNRLLLARSTFEASCTIAGFAPFIFDESFSPGWSSEPDIM